MQDRDHGEQFKADELRSTPPHTVEGIEKYLGSGLVKGIGPHFARKIVEVFGERTLAVIDESPSFLKEVKGIGPRRIQRIRESWQQQKAVRAIMVFLQSHGVGTARAVRIYKTYGDQAVELVRANPYRLADRHLGRRLQDGRRAGRRARHRSRVAAARPRRPALRPAAAQPARATSATPRPASLDRTAGADRRHRHRRRDRRRGRRGGAAGRRRGARAGGGDEPWLYLKPLFLAELGVARSLQRLHEGDHPLPAPRRRAAAVAGVEQKMGLELAAAQRDAIRQAARDKVLVITGGPGIGKTTIVRGILEIFAGRGLRCALCARPAGRPSG